MTFHDSPTNIPDPEGNGKAEAFIKILKRELLSRHTFADLADLQAALDRFVHHYNHYRGHVSSQYLGVKSGADFPVCRLDRLESLPHVPSPQLIEKIRGHSQLGWQAPVSRYVGQAPQVIGVADIPGLEDIVIPGLETAEVQPPPEVNAYRVAAMRALVPVIG